MPPNAFEEAPTRNVQVNFQVSPEEKKMLDAAVKASGMSMAVFLRAAIYEKIKRETGKPKTRA